MPTQFPITGSATPAAGQDLQIVPTPSQGKIYQIWGIHIQIAASTPTTLTLKDGTRPIRTTRCANDADGILCNYTDDTAPSTANGLTIKSSAAVPIVWTIDGKEIG